MSGSSDDPPVYEDPEAGPVLAANRAFYDAFEQRDIDALSDAWEHSPRVSCTHPGWATLTGWAAVSGSFFALFQGPSTLQFVLTREQAHVEGPMAWVACDENLLGDQGGQTIAALNVFVRTEKGWRMVAHHGSVVSRSMQLDDE